MKYEVLQSDRLSVLEKEVDSYLDRGWQLQGGITVAYDHGEVRSFQKLVYLQAMVTFNKEPK